MSNDIPDAPERKFRLSLQDGSGNETVRCHENLGITIKECLLDHAGNEGLYALAVAVMRIRRNESSSLARSVLAESRDDFDNDNALLQAEVRFLRSAAALVQAYQKSFPNTDNSGPIPYDYDFNVADIVMSETEGR